MQNKNLSLKETFSIAVENYKKRNFELAENLCKKILNIEPNHSDSMMLLSNMYAINKNFKKAKDFLIEANKIQPGNLTILNNLGTAYKELGEPKKSISFYEEILKIDPNHTNANYNLGVAFYDKKDFKNSKQFFKKTTEVQPNYALAFMNLANIYAETKDYGDAISNYQKAIKINPKIVGAHNNLGLVFRALSDYKNAISCYKEAIKLKPDFGGAYHNLALALKELGHFGDAIKAHEKAILNEPNNLVNYFYLSELKKDVLDSSLKVKIKNILKDNKISKRNIAYGNYLLSKYEKKEQNYEKELNFLTKGHNSFFDSKREKFELGVKYCFQDVKQISESVTVIKTKKACKNEIKPIFIIGVPRCGSTLVEKIIGSGVKFIPMGEETSVLENFINTKIVEKKSLVIGEDNQINDELTEIYKQKGLIFKNYDYRFTDKSLNNFFYLELIKDIYPNSKIINCKRDSLSSIMSIFQNNISELAWAHDLDNIFKYFDNYINIISNYVETYPKIIYQLQYEKLINDPEKESKKLMEFCELPWDIKCLDFYKRKDLVSKTASNVQVRQAIYKDSLDKYKSYKPFLYKHGKKYSWFK